jgi:hypothetical protein
MSWLIWRQHRIELVFVVATVCLCSAFLALEHASLVTTYSDLGLGKCNNAASPVCSSNLQAFANQFGWLYEGVYWMLLLPAMLGIFIGAPLIAREIESGSYRFVWTQSVTRARWFFSKVIALIAGAILATAALSAVISWALWPLIRVEGILLLPTLNLLTTPLFDLTGTVALAATALALALGILAGALTRQTVLAMVLTVIVFTAVRIPVASFIRPNFAPPVVTTAAVNLNSDVPVVPNGAWLIKLGFIDGAGQTFDLIGVASARCQPYASDPTALQQCFQDIGLRSYAEYQPADRYWLFQDYEAAIYVVLAAVALLVAWSAVRWRLA